MVLISYVHYVLFALVISPYLSPCRFVSTSGLQVAMDMQEEITARREQVDTLQGKIQHLEEAMDNVYQVESIMYCISVCVDDSPASLQSG